MKFISIKCVEEDLNTYRAAYNKVHISMFMVDCVCYAEQLVNSTSYCDTWWYVRSTIINILALRKV